MTKINSNKNRVMRTLCFVFIISVSFWNFACEQDQKNKENQIEKIVITVKGDANTKHAAESSFKTDKGSVWKTVKLEAEKRITCNDDYTIKEWKFDDEKGTGIPDTFKFEKDTAVFAVSRNKQENFTAAGVSFNMVKIAGTKEVLLGDKEQTDNLPHKVSLSSYWIGEMEVTQELYDSVMEEEHQWAFTESGETAPDEGEVQKKRPCDILSWYECAAFCNALTQKVSSLGKAFCVYYSDKEKTQLYTKADAENKKEVFADWSKGGFRLPTEAEWIYAAHGGEKQKYAGTDDPKMLGTVAWFVGNSNKRTHQTGLKTPNGYGLYDMTGNVCEWCWDWFDDIAENQQITENPKGPQEDASWGKVLRGGSWAYSMEEMLLVRRDCCGADGKIPFTPSVSRYLGMRLAKNAE